MKEILVICCFVIITWFPISPYAYDIPSHKQIVLEASKIWQEIPPEITFHLGGENRLDARCKANYDIGDDIYVGSGEEDNESNFVFCKGIFSEHTDSNEGRNGFLEHFWNPDYPFGAPQGIIRREYNCDGENIYNLGLLYIAPDVPPFISPACGDHFDSNYRLAQDLWDNKVTPLYRSGSVDESYYWLGRVAHLLSDMGVPAHVQLRPHDPIISSKDLYEDFVTRNVVKKYSGNKFIGQEYRVDCLPNLCDFDWMLVHPNPTNLFKLFWYTAQKTQYYAGMNKKGNMASWGNDLYSTINGDQEEFKPTLWNGEAIPFSDPGQLVGRRAKANLQSMASALVPHALKAVAGLYRLFWEETRLGECRDNIGPLGTINYLCFLGGGAGVPGDGLIASSEGGLFDFMFDVSPALSLAGITDGLTVSIFPLANATQNFHFQLNFTVRQAIDRCSPGLGAGPLMNLTVNGVPGRGRNISQDLLLGLLNLVKSDPECAEITLDDFLLSGILLMDGQTGEFIRSVDAIAIGSGINSFPVDTAP